MPPKQETFRDSMIRDLERALFMARNGKIIAVVALILDDKNETTQIMQCDGDQITRLIGLSALMHRDVMNLAPEWTPDEDEESEDDEG